MATAPSLENVLHCPNLPSLPAVAVDVLALTNKRNVNLGEIARAVQNDQALTAKILRTVNSSYYGLSKPCPTITRALGYLGLGTVKSLVLGFSLVDTTRAPSGFSLAEYWRRAVYGAAAARRIASTSGCCDPEEAFIAALMQDVGMPALHASGGATYEAVLKQAGGSHERLSETEMAALGFDHCIVGARLGEKWRLPGELVLAIRHHHAPDDAPAPQRNSVRAVALGVHAAAALSAANAFTAMARLRSLGLDWFGFSDEQTDGLLSQITEDARDIARLFRVETGAAPDINHILAQAEEASLRLQFDAQREAETLRQTNTDLARIALTDGLTGAGNRTFFDAELHRLYAHSRATGAPLAVIMVDADRFKVLNDTYGHQVGDAVLIEIARRMRSVASDPGALVCRYGGEEFAIVLPNADRRVAAHMAEQVRSAIAQAPVVIRVPGAAAPNVGVTVSVGVAALDAAAPGRITSAELLVQASDKALYAAKSAGRNCVRIFSERANNAMAA